MSRTISMYDDNWHEDVNYNFDLLLSEPKKVASYVSFPYYLRYSSCLVFTFGDLILSTDTGWDYVRNKLSFVSDLPPEATIDDVIFLLDSLISDMVTKGHMLPS